MENELSRLSLSIKGRVQGIGFRTGAKSVADEFGITGIAVNNEDGSIEITAEGEKFRLMKLLEWCFKGPILAKVSGIDFKWEIYTGEFSNFEIIRGRLGLLGDQIKVINSSLKRSLVSLPSNTIVPNHIAVIPDGNRRWARARGLHTLEGHRRGFNNLVRISEASRKFGVKYITVWGFSTENWSRSEEECGYLMKLFSVALKKYEKSLHKDKVRFRHLGRTDRLPEVLIRHLERLENETKDYDQYFINIALDYGGRDEILRAIQKIDKASISLKDISDPDFTKFLDTQECPAPDLIIRTSGEQRLSGFLPWQSTYSELYFTSAHFPDFNENELKYAIIDYSLRQRRFGK